MASGRRKRTASSTRGLKASAAAPQPPLSIHLPAIEALVFSGEGQISIGSIGPIACAAVASDEYNMLAALVRRPGETLGQLLERLEHAVELGVNQDTFTDEINPP